MCWRKFGRTCSGGVASLALPGVVGTTPVEAGHQQGLEWANVIAESNQLVEWRATTRQRAKLILGLRRDIPLADVVGLASAMPCGGFIMSAAGSIATKFEQPFASNHCESKWFTHFTLMFEARMRRPYSSYRARTKSANAFPHIPIG